MSLSKFQRSSFTLASSLVAASLAHAQVASAILREGDVMTGGPAGAVANAPITVAVNDSGGYAARVDSSNTGSTLSHAWGHATGGAGTILRTEGTFAPYTQTAWEAFFGVDGQGRIAYSPTVTGGTVSPGDSVWFDSSPVAVEGEPSSVSGQFWRFASRPTSTDDGIPFFVGGLTNVSGGATQGYIFAKGPSGTSLVRAGDVLPNLPSPIGTGSISFNYGVSAHGNHWIISAAMTGSTATDGVVIVDGAGLMLGGALVREGSPLPASIGGVAGESWANFDYKAYSEAGDWMLTGDSSIAGNDEFIIYDGSIRFREGDVIDGAQTVNSIQAACMNEAGTIAYVWEIVTALGNKEALFVDDHLLLVEGQAVDLDGDGTVEPNSIVVDLGGDQTLGLTSDGTVIFIADVDVNGTTSTSDDVTAVFRIAPLTSPPTAYCTAGTTTNGCVASISASANPSVSFANPCNITVSNVEGQKNGIVFYGLAANAVPWGVGSTSFLCVKTPTQRSAAQFSNGTVGLCDGVLALDWNAYQSSNPGALGQPWAAGNQAFVQAWFRDPPASKTTNLSDGVALTYVP